MANLVMERAGTDNDRSRVTTPQRSRLTSGSTQGQAVMEIGLMLPWMVISFIGVVDFGLCAYGLIATQDAARVGAAWASATSANAQGANLSTTVCPYALGELQSAIGVGTSVTTCGNGSPVSVTATYLAAAQSADKQNPAVSVAVTYTVPLLALPAIMPASFAITRTVQLPVRN